MTSRKDLVSLITSTAVAALDWHWDAAPSVPSPEDCFRDVAEAIADALGSEYVTRDWNGLMAILDAVYPEKTFPTSEDREDRDPRPRIISLIRQLDQARPS
jgi:hypothetical protein